IGLASDGGSTGSAVATGRKRSTTSARISIRLIVTTTVARLTRNALNFGTRPPPPIRLADPFQDAHLVRDRGTAHVEYTAEARMLHLDIAGGSGELHGAERVHRDTGGADRVTLGLEPAGWIDRKPPVRLGDAVLDRARTAPFRDESHGFVFDQLRN